MMNNGVFIQEFAIVQSNKLISETMWEAILESPEIAESAMPGQFVNILPSKDWDHIMRRPMSIGGTDGNSIKVLYKVIGPGTELMSNWKKGDTVDLIGPLGNQWEINQEKQSLLIAGGVGVVPLLFLQLELNMQSISHQFIMGARTKSDHFLQHNPESGIWLTTDDGSMGISGNVISALEEIEKNTHSDKIKIYTCGPSVMLESVRNYALKNNNIECEIALECIMACGIGICQGCAVEMIYTNSNTDTYRDRFKLVCIDGPIYKAESLKTCLV